MLRNTGSWAGHWSNWVWFWLSVGLEGSSSSFQPQVLRDCHRQVHVLEGHNQNLKATTVKAIPTVLILASVIYAHRKEKKKAKHVAHPKISFQNLSLHPPTIIFLVSAKLWCFWPNYHFVYILEGVNISSDWLYKPEFCASPPPHHHTTPRKERHQYTESTTNKIIQNNAENSSSIICAT